MKPTDELLRGAVSTIRPQGPLAAPDAQKPAKLDDGTIEVVNDLFADLQAICSAWRRDWGDAAAMKTAKRNWTKAFMEAGITRVEQIERGKQVCRARTGRAAAFLPAMGEFMEWCWPDPQELGLPGVGLAFQEAVRNSHPAFIGSAVWSHKAIYHAALACGRDKLLRLPGDVSRERFEKAYRDVQKQLLNGVVLADAPPPDQKALPKLADPEKGRQAICALRATLAGGA
ncbi:replication protein P [Pseudomonas sp.]|uniref:replication protein P n=1 Tax=Pseudomonas sp. TaxID=306 RepID=UPI003CC623EC